MNKALYDTLAECRKKIDDLLFTMQTALVEEGCHEFLSGLVSAQSTLNEEFSYVLNEEEIEDE